jgi:hypothetical protein
LHFDFVSRNAGKRQDVTLIWALITQARTTRLLAVNFSGATWRPWRRNM